MLELNRVYCGDCLELMREIPDESVDVVITDPPYGIQYRKHDKTGKYRTAIAPILNDGDQRTGIKAIRQLSGIPIAVFASPMKPWPGKWRQYLVWDKGGASGGGGDIATCWKFTWELIQIAHNT